MAQIKIRAVILLLIASSVFAASPELMDKALTAEGEQRWQEALSIYEKILDREPTDVEVWVRVADIHAQLDHTQEFVKASQEAVRLRPNDPQLHYRLSQAFGVNDQPYKAMSAIKEALAIAPSNPDYLLQQAETAFWVDNYRLAKSSYRKILVEDPDNQAARQGLAKVSAAEPKLFDLALQAEGEKRWQDALSLYKRILAKNPSEVQAWIQVADIHANLGQTEEFVQASREAVRLRPNDPQLHFRLSQAYGLNENPEQALASVNQALALDPDNPDYLLQQAKTAYWLGNYELAKNGYRKILEIDPDNTTAQQALEALAAAGNLPAAALNAEGEGRWADAVKIYRLLLEADPNQPDLWLRIADIHTSQNQTDQALQAMANAAALLPNDSELHYNLAREYAANNQPEKALEAVQQAVSIEPRNANYLRLQVQLALWIDDTNLAYQTYETLLAINPDDREALHGIAQLQSRAGKLDLAVQTYEQYLGKYPQDAEVLLAYAETEIYRGDYAHADELQQQYLERKGVTREYQRARANLHARSGRPERALRLVEPLLAEEPEDYDLNLIRTLALNEYRQKRAAREALPTLERLGRTRPETPGARLEVETSLRPFVGGGLDFYSDTDDIRIMHGTVFGGYSPTPETQVTAGIGHRRLKADSGSGLEPLSGSSSIELDEAWVTSRHQFSPKLAGAVGIGLADGRNDNTLTMHLDVDYWFHDRLFGGYRFNRDVVAVSPRAVDVFIPRNIQRLVGSWQPGYRSYVDAELLYADYDDDNDLTQLTISPRWVTMRTQKHNLDLGLSAQWSSFSKDLNNGYYDPDDFVRLWGMLYYYRKLSENDGISVTVGLGPERDRDLDDGYEMGGNLRVDGIFGFYRDWQFRGYAELGGRFSGSGAGSAAGEIDAFRNYGLGFEIIRRF